jgi:c(7)-type cytochrome triheme protein
VFSHAHHAARGGAGATCTTCHAPLLAIADVTLPRPTAATCAVAGCHDDRAAFAPTAACTRCHAAPPAQTFVVARPTLRFVHARHLTALATRPCAACHPLDRRGDPTVAGHAACTGCHADFGDLKPRICGACHTATEPWRHLVVDQRPADETEFGARLDHGKHGGPCASCHQRATATRQLRPPRGHAACSGDGCHATSAAGPTPPLTDCTACHERGLVAARILARLAAPWTTRAQFDHAAHRGDPTAPLACGRCHVGADAAPSIAAMPTPPKASCAPCHDGQTSFKLTGTSCGRCHRAGP